MAAGANKSLSSTTSILDVMIATLLLMRLTFLNTRVNVWCILLTWERLLNFVQLTFCICLLVILHFYPSTQTNHYSFLSFIYSLKSSYILYNVFWSCVFTIASCQLLLVPRLYLTTSSPYLFFFFSFLLLMIPSPVSGSQGCMSGDIHWDIDYLLAVMFSSLSNH